ncbi:hypothetical protein EAE96_011271 [Botrytis aclada]|nr:hypothetical protein EAE96_011271 [Botrytis aclada]
MLLHQPSSRTSWGKRGGMPTPQQQTDTTPMHSTIPMLAVGKASWLLKVAIFSNRIHMPSTQHSLISRQRKSIHLIPKSSWS